MSSDQLDALIRALGSTSPETRVEAVRLAADVASPELLVSVVRSEVPVAIRSGAMDALRLIGERALPPILREAEKDGHGSIFCLQLLAWFPDDDAGFELLCRIAAGSSALRQQAAIEALGLRGDARAIPVLGRALQGELWVAMAAVVALGRSRDPRALDELRKVASDPWLGSTATDALARAEQLTPGSGEVRK